jgi:stage II sporulation protein D
VANEVWPSFETEAYRAQAIVARTYVLHQMERRRRAAFDVRATEGSQVYRGIRRDGPGRRAAEAARYTRGIVCTCRSRRGEGLFSTYYSAACGGASQSAAIFGKADDIPPLRGGVRCDYCKIAPGETYRWGPVRMGQDEVLSSLIERYPELVSLGDIVAIEPIERTPFGRPVRLRITGSSGQEHDILAERFRLAIGSRVVRSTDCDIRVLKDEVIFDNGRGFGHGLGLCQWGAQGQALEGKRAGEILRFYYPGSRLTRVY